MNFTQNDFKETNELAKLLQKIDRIDEEYVNSMSADIFQCQPFFLTVLLGYRFDTSTEELEEIMKVYFLIWEYFKTNKDIRAKKVTKEMFEKVQNKHLQMLQYIKSDLSQQEKMQIYSNEFQKLQSKALLAAILFRYTNRPILAALEDTKKGIILIGSMCFIESFEKLS